MLAKAGASGGSPDLLGSLFWWCRPYLIALFIAFLPLVLIAVLATDCVQVIMYSQRIGVKKAWGALLALLKRDIGEFVKYLLLKLGFGVVSIFVALALAVLALAAMYGAGAAFSRIGVYVNMLVPPEGRVIVAMALVIITSFAMAGLSVLLAFIFVPIPVFFRLFSIYFTGSLGDECDPFIERTTEPLSKEEFEKLKAETDVSKHNRPIYMLWCTILSSIGIVALFVAMLFEGGRALGRAEAYSLGATMSGPVQLGRQVTPPRTPNENLVKVRLKTGRSFVATIEMETDSSVSFRVKEGTFTFRRDTIESIERQKQ
jgi:hypothetical protein